MIYLCGGPPHQDMYDIKVDAPAEVRGEFDPIPTAVPGIEICELLPKLAGIMDKLVPIRTIVGCQDDHAGYQCFTGHLSQNAPAGGWPHIGSSSSRLQGPVLAGRAAVRQPLLRHAAQAVQRTERGLSRPRPHRLPPDGRRARRPRAARHHGRSARRPPQPALLGRSASAASGTARGTMDGMDTFTQRAMGILTSSEFFDALDITQGRRRRPATATATTIPSRAQGGRRPARAAEPAARPPTGRSGRARRHGQLQLLGLARPELQERQGRTADLRQGGLAPWSKTCTSGAWPTTAPSSPGANSAARRRSTKTPAATTGRASRAPCSPAAA